MTEPELPVERPAHGVGPHPEPWPDDPRLDPELLREGDTRNVVDRYRYWSMAAIVADLDERRHPFHVAIENWQHDMNIGSIVRTANAFLAAEVHIVGRRRWNKRGAMVTDRYQHVRHHESVAELVEFARARGLTIVAVDNVEGSRAGGCPAPARAVPAALRAGGPRAERRGARRGLRGRRDPAVRVDPVDERRSRRRRRHARVGAGARGPGRSILTRSGREDDDRDPLLTRPAATDGLGA